MRKTNDNKKLTQMGYGLTSAALIGSYSLCISAVFGRGAVFALICTIACALFSLKGKGHIFAPAPLLILPLYIFTQAMPVLFCSFAILGGGIICLALNMVSKKREIPPCIITGGAIGLAIGVTIILTNAYFGIGSFGGTVLEMLKNYRYLGFHPDFRGLLFGTITLFTMITYPFKFRKLNKYIPAEFITILIPFIINLLLNNPETTTTDEYTFASARVALSTDFITTPKIIDVVGAALAMGLIFYGFTQSKDKLFPLTNMVTGALSGNAVAPYPVRGYTGISAITVIIVCSAVIFFCPSLVSRLPLPCAGAMLIVSAWQHVPFKGVSATIKEKSIIKILALVLCAVSFIILSAPIATVLCAILATIISKLSSHSRREETA